MVRIHPAKEGAAMGLTVTEKIIASHCGGTMRRGEPLAIRVDQTLTQDATGTMAYLQFETMGLDRVQTELSVSYVDHNTLQEDWKNMDDHRYLQSVAAKYGLWFSRAGNGICHQVHLERFGEPGKTLLGSDSHTPTGGGLGMLAIGAGGLDVAAALGGGPFHLLMPRIIGVRLSGALSGAAAAKDIILELLRRETVKGGVGSVYEYFGEGVRTLSIPQRATITNMGAELGATSSVFPSDESTRAFLADRGREAAWRELRADAGAVYDRIIDIDLAALKPLAAQPHAPDAVCPVAEIAGKPVDQVIIGSCTNSSLEDLAAAAEIVRGKTVHRRVSAALAPGSRITLLAADKAGILGELIRAGFRILESACGPCIGMGAAPKSKGVSLRTFNRNFKGRSGTADAEIYLVSAESAAAAVSGCIADPSSFPIVRRDMGPFLRESLAADRDGMLIPPPAAEEGRGVIIERGPNIKPCPVSKPVEDNTVLPVLLKAGDNITTDDIMPAGAKVLPLRSNIPELSKFMFIHLDPGFWQRAQDAGAGIIVGGNNYGQGSSREHAALVPMYLGIRGIIAKSFARIHKANLINFGILPLVFADPGDYDRVFQGDMLEFRGIHSFLEKGGSLTVLNTGRGESYSLVLEAEERDRNILRAGGLIPHTTGKEKHP
jgi:aconitate hydratase